MSPLALLGLSLEIVETWEVMPLNVRVDARNATVQKMIWTDDDGWLLLA
jgi:hypothetical protein